MATILGPRLQILNVVPNVTRNTPRCLDGLGVTLHRTALAVKGLLQPVFGGATRG